MEKITYLLGAGASCQILPLIKENRGLGKPGLTTNLENFVQGQKANIISNSGWNIAQYEKLLVLIKSCKQFVTPDLAAKFFLERKDLGNYLLLKKLISNYFSYFEAAPDLTGTGFEGRSLDSRVVPFLATISDKNKLPDNLKIVSWNYDAQLEMGAKMLQAFPGSGVNDFDEKFYVWPFKATNSDRSDKNYFLLHLNGVSGYNYSANNLAVKIDSPFNFTEEAEPLVSFAWEDDATFNKTTFTEKRTNLARKMIEGTTVLIVIGYSFPFFNRKIDSNLFSYMKGTLKKIYFQDPVLDGQFLYSQFDLVKDQKAMLETLPLSITTEIIHIKNVDQYYVPFEL